MQKQHLVKNPQPPTQAKPVENASQTEPYLPQLTPDTILKLHSLVGNQAVQRLLATRIQRDPEPSAEAEMVFTVEDSLGDEAAANMERDFAVSESTEEIIYINTPGFIQGMGYTSKRMASIYDPLKKLKARVLKSSAYTNYTQAGRAYQKALKDGDKAKLKDLENARDAARDALKTTLTDKAVEGEEGKKARQVVRDYWLKQKKGGTLADDILDPGIIPALKLQQRRNATVTFDGYHVSSRTHQESRLSYYADAFNYNGIRPAKQPSEAADKSKKKFSSSDMQRVYDIYQLLIGRKFGASESKILATISSGEGSFSTTQSLDRVRFSWGLIQFQGDTLMSVLENIRKNDQAFFRQYFESYGIMMVDSTLPLKPKARHNRETAGEDYGVPSKEAQGVDRLAVYDHQAGEWVSGNEGLAVIQGDPRYQAIFAVVGQKDEGQYAQMLTARDDYVKRALNWKITLKEGKKTRKVIAKDVIKNEKTMYALIDRTVHEGNPHFVTAMLNAYCKKQKISIDRLADSPDQADIASYAVKYTAQAGVPVRWNLLKNIPPDIPALSETDYQ